MVTGSWHSTPVSARHIDEDKLKLWVWTGLLVAGIATLGLLYLTIAGSVASANRDIQGLRAESRYWQTTTEQLKVELASLQSVERINSEAPQRLGMSLPKIEAVAYRTVPAAPGLNVLPALAFADPAANSPAQHAAAVASTLAEASGPAADPGWWGRVLAAVWPVQVGQAQEIASAED